MKRDQKAKQLFEAIHASEITNKKDRAFAERYFIAGFCFKAEKNQKPPENALFKPFIEVWDKHYHGILDMPKDGAKIKSLIFKTENYLNKSNDHSQTAFQFWEWIVERLKNTWYHSKGLGVIESKFYEIVYELKHGKPSGKQLSKFSRQYNKQGRIDGL